MKMKLIPRVIKNFMLLAGFLIVGFQVSNAQSWQEPHIYVLGISQDGGYPHTGCQGDCCKRAWETDSLRRFVVSLALVDPETHRWWLFEATPDIREQLHYFQKLTGGYYNFLPEGIFLTHAHIGHYTGLMELGREVMNTHSVPVYALPKMCAFLETNGPWSQLVNYKNIALNAMAADSPVHLGSGISVIAERVPHRDEYSETAGFIIQAGKKKYLFIPDINKWDIWDRKITDQVKAVDIALVDATFFDENEMPNMKHTLVPHPFVQETMNLFKEAPASEKRKIHFIHFNHTNPALWDVRKQNDVINAGFRVAHQGEQL